jgi:hypothetical protein
VHWLSRKQARILKEKAVGHFKALFCHLPAETEEDFSYLLETLKKIIRKMLTPFSANEVAFT